MATKRMHISQQFDGSVADLFDFLSVHENLSLIFSPAKVTLVKPGATHINGLVSVRKLKIPLQPSIEETVTAFEPNKRIEYKITNTTPLVNHKGTMLFTELGAKRSQLDYHMEYDGRFPLVAPIVQRLLNMAIKRGLKKIRI